jgi:V8-like Glu-specific endopeptidase
MFQTLARMFSRSKKAAFPAAQPARFCPQLEQLENRLVPSLTPIPANAGYPYSAVVEIQATFPDGQTYVGSGAMVDPSHVLTAGHVLYSAKDGGYAQTVTVTPDLNGNSAPFGSAYATYENVDPTYVQYSQAHPGQTSTSVNDIGLVTLNRPIGNSTGTFGFGYDNNNADFTNAVLYTAGYPASYGYNGRQMYASAGHIIGANGPDGLAAYEGNVTVLPGQSGSPLFAANNIIYGVVSGYSGSTASNSVDYFSRITQTVFNELRSWGA